ncbi:MULTISPECIES: ATPase [Vibrio]|uniref:ATPase n=1 Tax=Vibrio TaxID=662 RepID=UPI00193FA5BF|nr:ATPase [Vibrio parahaemolyticus]EGR1335456.1 ATPase [Vibrio parahaemolyticus]EGU0149416.1 ATPase [Vibrio parahaemolyticus]EJE4182554.1 ATPase [Vibrio parahaemolyticus]MBM4972881.1 ATPase [Vibrio parahaemolyticus]MCR9671443.1 ATPase [Vibrio parahaemolyticus]
MQQTNELIEFADKYLFKERHGYNNSVINPVGGMVKLTGLSRNTVQQAFAGKKCSKLQVKVLELLEIIVTDDQKKMKEIREIARKKQ